MSEMGITIMGGDLARLKVGQVPKGLLVRPILARIKKSLFDILKNRIQDSKFLDLFAGSGSVGLEALSRGASKVVFLEANPICVRWISNTLSKISRRNGGQPDLGEFKVVRSDVLKGFYWLNEEFDLIFSGAPYKDERKKPLLFVQSLLGLIHRDGAIRPGGWFIAQHHEKENFDVTKSWKLFRQEHYGDSMLSFFEHV